MPTYDPREARTPYKIDEVDSNTTYLMYYDDSSDKQEIIKVSKSSTETTITKALDNWSNRTSATYSAINT